MAKSWCLLPILTLLTACNGGKAEKGKALARVNGKNFTQGELDARLQSTGRLDAANQDPEERRKEFNRMLRSRLGALATQKAGLNHDALKRRLEMMDQRVMTQYYYDTYLHTNGGLTRKQIEDHYRAHPAQFRNDSGKTLPFAAVAQRAADSLLISRANLDSFYQANRDTYREKAYCDASVIQTNTRKEADAALKALQGGMKFTDAVAKYSKHPSNTSQGRIARVVQGEKSYDLGAGTPADSLFFDPKGRLKPGQISGPIPKDSGYIMVRPDSCREEVLPSMASLRGRITDDYLRKLKTDLNQKGAEALKAKYKARLITPFKPISDAEIAAYYEKNKTTYESPETFELYHVEAANKEKLQGKFQAVKDAAGFKALASQASENAWTKPASGYLGVVKRDFTLPYGIGLMPALFPALDAVKEGKVGPIQNSDTRKWHFFWLAKKGPRQAKPLDRVRRLVRSDLETNRVTEIAPTDTLAALGDGTLIRESDVLFLQEEIPPQIRARYTRDNLVDYLLMWRLAAQECKALGLVDEPTLVGSRLENDDAYWDKVYQDSVLARTAEEDTTLLAKTFKEKRKLFTRDSTDMDWHGHVRDIASYLRLTPKDFDLEFRTNPEKYNRDTLPATVAAAETDVFYNLKDVGAQRQDQRQFDRLKSRFKVKILDKSLEEPSLEPAGEFFKQAQGLHYDRRLDQALGLYEKLRVKYADRADLQDSICFGVAQINIEQEKYQQALAEYRRVNLLYPNSPNNYKAMFMIGFIQSEHLKHDSDAVRSFEKMLAKYPSTDLSDDADWMVKNIRSGGKLMPVLEGDSGWVAPDSGKAADTPKKK